MIVAHNLAAMNAQRMFGINSKSKTKSAEKLSSGYKVNRAADDAAGLAISEKMRRMIRGLNQGAENTQDGISFVQIGDGAMEEVHDIVHRMTELSIQAANGTLTEEDRSYIDQEVQQLKKEINRIADSTTFNEIPVFDNNAVTFGLQGSPNDLQIFNATYDDVGNIATYGGFLFHGERITWDMIDSGMVTTDANGQQVFNGGDYSYTSDETGYSFAFSCKDGDVPPIITREISIAADASGVYLGEEFFDWSKVYDTNGDTLNVNDLHAGPWAIDYYGSKFIFTVSEPIEDIEDFARDIDSCKNSAVYYNWEVYYSEGAGETAVDVLEDTVILSPNNENWCITQENVDTMLNSNANGLIITIGAGEDGIWLVDNNGQALTDSLVTWEEMGIDSWEEGMEIPGLSSGNSVTYTYTDPRTGTDGTGLNFQFELSDITSKDSVIDGLNGMIITADPGFVHYVASASSNDATGNVTLSKVNSKLFLEFEEQVAENRDFDEEHWTTGAQEVKYENGQFVVNFAGGFSLSTEATNAETTVSGKLEDYLSEIASAKIRDAIDNTQLSKDDFQRNYLSGTGNSETGEVKIEVIKDMYNDPDWIDLTYSYNYKSTFDDLFERVSVKISNATSDEALNYPNGVFVQNADGSFTTVTEKCEDAAKNAENAYVYDSSKTAEENENLKIAAGEHAYEQEKQTLASSAALYKFGLTYSDKDGNAVSTQKKVAESYMPGILKSIAQSTQIDITADSYAKTGVEGREKVNEASRPAYIAVMKETPAEPDIYIVHSSVEGDMTGIPRFAMNTAALGVAFVDCKTAENAMQTMASTKNALNYVSSKRAYYGALQNRLEHTYNNNRNISENMTAAESQIRDTDMAKEMVKYSNDSILEQVGQAMMAQANQSNQGVLSLLN